ncbi:MAG: hypothetical protein IKF90_02765 [Parasporobacterium sp.]|nr:hypothetical protein [Parasporobacterium sp.]
MAIIYTDIQWNKDEDAEGYDLFECQNENRIFKVSIFDNDITNISVPIEGNQVVYDVYSFYVVRGEKRYLTKQRIIGEKRVVEKDNAAQIIKANSVNRGVLLNGLPVTAGTAFLIYRKSKNSPYKMIGKAKEKVFLDQTVQKGLAYTYSIQSIKKSGEGKPQRKELEKITIAYLNEPSLISVVTHDNSVRVIWEMVEGASKYRVYRRTGKSEWKEIGDTDRDFFIDTDQGSDVSECYYTVRCVSSDGTQFQSGYNVKGIRVKQ